MGAMGRKMMMTHAVLRKFEERQRGQMVDSSF